MKFVETTNDVSKREKLLKNKYKFRMLWKSSDGGP